MVDNDNLTQRERERERAGGCSSYLILFRKSERVCVYFVILKNTSVLEKFSAKTREREREGR